MDIKQLSRQALPYVGYAVFFSVLFVLFAIMTFPYDRVRDFVLAKVNGGQGPGPRSELRLGDLSPRLLLGAHMEDIEYRSYENAADSDPGILKLSELSVSTSLVGLLTGNHSFSFSGNEGGGSLEGTYEMSGEDVHVSLELEDLDLKAVGLGSYLGFPLEGIATGEVDLVLTKDPAQSNGSIHVDVEGVALGDGKAKLTIPGMREGLTIERVDAGKLTVVVDLQQGTATLTDVSAKGPDLTLDGKGNVKLADPMVRSRLNVALQFRFADDYKARDAKTKALFELMGFRPELKRATTPEGDLRFELRGFLGSPRATPAGRSK